MVTMQNCILDCMKIHVSQSGEGNWVISGWFSGSHDSRYVGNIWNGYMSRLSETNSWPSKLGVGRWVSFGKTMPCIGFRGVEDGIRPSPNRKGTSSKTCFFFEISYLNVYSACLLRDTWNHLPAAMIFGASKLVPGPSFLLGSVLHN